MLPEKNIPGISRARAFLMSFEGPTVTAINCVCSGNSDEREHDAKAQDSMALLLLAVNTPNKLATAMPGSESDDTDKPWTDSTNHRSIRTQLKSGQTLSGSTQPNWTRPGPNEFDSKRMHRVDVSWNEQRGNVEIAGVGRQLSGQVLGASAARGNAGCLLWTWRTGRNSKLVEQPLL